MEGDPWGPGAYTHPPCAVVPVPTGPCSAAGWLMQGRGSGGEGAALAQTRPPALEVGAEAGRELPR